MKRLLGLLLVMILLAIPGEKWSLTPPTPTSSRPSLGLVIGWFATDAVSSRNHVLIWLKAIFPKEWIL
jgi:hypothetical protein